MWCVILVTYPFHLKKKNHISALRFRHIELNYWFCSFIKIIKRLVRKWKKSCFWVFFYSVKNNYSKKRSGKTSRKQFSIAIILESTSYTLENLSDLSFLVGGPFWTLKMLRAYVKNDKSYLVIFQIWFLNHFPPKKMFNELKNIAKWVEQRLKLSLLQYVLLLLLLIIVVQPHD